MAPSVPVPSVPSVQPVPPAKQGHAVVRIAPATARRRGVTGALALRPEAVPDRPRGRHLAVVGDPQGCPGRVEAGEDTGRVEAGEDTARVNAGVNPEAAVRVVIEILAGTRPPRHLSARADPEVWQGLAVHRVPSAGRARIPPPRVLRTWAQSPVPGAVETGAVVVLGGRVHGLALRMEHHRGRWRYTAIETTVPA